MWGNLDGRELANLFDADLAEETERRLRHISQLLTDSHGELVSGEW